MLFRPNFCANCATKIERAEWMPWTSRRFCQVCEIEFKGQDLLPKAVVAASLVIGLFGVGAYLTSSKTDSEIAAFKQAGKKAVYSTPVTVVKETPSAISPPTNKVISGQPESPSVSSTTGSKLVDASIRPKIEQEEQVFYCSAETKKGTPCSRRVKKNTRCYQHVGMPAMGADEKLETRSQK